MVWMILGLILLYILGAVLMAAFLSETHYGRQPKFDIPAWVCIVFWAVLVVVSIGVAISNCCVALWVRVIERYQELRAKMKQQR